MRFNLDSIFVADRGLIIIGCIIVIYSIICIIGILTNNLIILLIVYYNSMLTIICLSVFALGALALNENIINWIDNHWDVIRQNVFSYDMNKFKDHVTTEINSLGIFSLTLNATLIITMVCITNLLSFKNILLALSPLTNLIFTVLSSGLIWIGFYSQQHAYYTTIPTWSSTLIIILGFVLILIGVLGYYSIQKMSRKLILLHIIILSICVCILIIGCLGFFYIANKADEIVNANWSDIHENLIKYGYQVRKSFLLNQIQINLKFAGFYSLAFILFSLISLGTSIYQHNII
jgi:hypothetical protein